MAEEAGKMERQDISVYRVLTQGWRLRLARRRTGKQVLRRCAPQNDKKCGESWLKD